MALSHQPLKNVKLEISLIILSEFWSELLKIIYLKKNKKKKKKSQTIESPYLENAFFVEKSGNIRSKENFFIFYYLKTLKTLWSLFIDGVQLSQGYRATMG